MKKNKRNKNEIKGDEEIQDTYKKKKTEKHNQ